MLPDPHPDDTLELLKQRLQSLAQPMLTANEAAALRGNAEALKRVQFALDELELNPYSVTRLRATLKSISQTAWRDSRGVMSQFRAPPNRDGDGGGIALPPPFTAGLPGPGPSRPLTTVGASPSPSQAPPKPINACEDEVVSSSHREFDQHVVFGRNHAIEFQNCLARNRRHLTVNLKAAEASDGADCKRGMAWSKAVVVSLEPYEIGLLLNVLLGRLPHLRIAGHGAANDKWLVAEQAEGVSEGAVRVLIAQGQRRLSVNIGFRDIIEVIGVCERAGTDGLRLRYIDTEHKLARQADMYLKEQARGRNRQLPGGSAGNTRPVGPQCAMTDAPKGARP